MDEEEFEIKVKPKKEPIKEVNFVEVQKKARKMNRKEKKKFNFKPNFGK